MKSVSVIIPIYNVEAYLERCLNSVVEQTYKNLQIILVDDGSTDRCPEICDAWAAKDIRIIVVHQANRGVGAARNAGLEAATGEFLIQIDSDDYIAPQAIELLVRAANQTSADMVICDFLQGGVSDYQFPSKSDMSSIECIDRQAALTRIYIDDHHALQYAASWGKLYRRNLFAGICYPEGKIFEDIYVTHRLIFQCKKIAVLSDKLFYYFQRPGSIMNTAFSMKKLDYLQALVERVSFFTKHDLRELACIAYDELLHALIWEYSRTRDVLNSEEGMQYVVNLYRKVYKKGYASRRYPQETSNFLAAFNHNPEWIIQYWRITGVINGIVKRIGGHFGKTVG